VFKFNRIFVKNLSRRNRFFRSHRGISPIIATLLILGLVTTGVVIGLFQILPFIERSSIESGLTATQTGLIELDNTIHNLITEGGGFRKVEIDKPLGILTLLPEEDYNFFEISNTTDILFEYNNSVGKIYFETISGYDIIPLGQFKYLSGPNPSTKRDQIAFVDLTKQIVSDYSDMSIINMTRVPDSIEIEFFYRPKIVVSQNGPDIDIKIQIYKLVWDGSVDFLAVENTRNQIGVSYSSNSITSTIRNVTLSSNELISIDYQYTGAESQPSLNWQSLWTSVQDAAPGNLLISVITHEIELVSFV
jgi:hypothetical protein